MGRIGTVAFYVIKGLCQLGGALLILYAAGLALKGVSMP